MRVSDVWVCYFACVRKKCVGPVFLHELVFCCVWKNEGGRRDVAVCEHMWVHACINGGLTVCINVDVTICMHKCVRFECIRRCSISRLVADNSKPITKVLLLNLNYVWSTLLLFFPVWVGGPRGEEEEGEVEGRPEEEGGHKSCQCRGCKGWSRFKTVVVYWVNLENFFYPNYTSKCSNPWGDTCRLKDIFYISYISASLLNT